MFIIIKIALRISDSSTDILRTPKRSFRLLPFRQIRLSRSP